MGGGSYPASQTPCQWQHESGDAFTADYHEQGKIVGKRQPSSMHIPDTPPTPRCVCNPNVSRAHPVASLSPVRLNAPLVNPFARELQRASLGIVITIPLGHLQSYSLGWLRPSALVDTRCNQVSHRIRQHVTDTLNPNTLVLAGGLTISAAPSRTNTNRMVIIYLSNMAGRTVLTGLYVPTSPTCGLGARALHGIRDRHRLWLFHRSCVQNQQ